MSDLADKITKLKKKIEQQRALKLAAEKRKEELESELDKLGVKVIELPERIRGLEKEVKDIDQKIETIIKEANDVLNKNTKKN
jgi:chromosome segregation ATPase